MKVSAVFGCHAQEVISATWPLEDNQLHTPARTLFDVRSVLHVTYIRVSLHKLAPANASAGSSGLTSRRSLLLLALAIIQRGLQGAGDDQELVPVIRILYVVDLVPY
jgi:hypothetical protein